MRKKILLFSTLNPYPFWAGSEKFWFDFFMDERSRGRFQFHARLADSPVTHARGKRLKDVGVDVSFYKHFNVNFTRRNIARLTDRIAGHETRTLPWYDEIARGKYDLVWFNVDGLHNLGDIEYAVEICKRKRISYWIILQHAYEDFFFSTTREATVISDIASGAKRFVFIADRNRATVERAMGERLGNAFHSSNALTAKEIQEAAGVAAIEASEPVRLFSLGRFSPKDKGQHLLLEVLGGGDWRERHWKMSFVGLGDFGQSYIERLTKFFGIDPNQIEFTPFTDDVFSAIAKHDILLMPSLAEGTPFAMIESMACGRPAVGTSVGGIPELIRDGETGWLAPAADVSSIAEAMERMWADIEKWPSMGAAARKNVMENHNQAITHPVLIDALMEDLG